MSPEFVFVTLFLMQLFFGAMLCWSHFWNRADIDDLQSRMDA